MITEVKETIDKVELLRNGSTLANPSSTMMEESGSSVSDLLQSTKEQPFLTDLFRKYDSLYSDIVK